MKKYCPNCRKVFDNALSCPECKKHPILEMDADEPVLLGKFDYLRAEMLKPLLDDAEIPATFSGGLSSAFGMNIGMRLDVISVYVPYSAYETAFDLTRMLDNSYETEEEMNANN